MDRQVLVAYATKHGATAEIAERIGQVLREAGLSTDVRAADRVDDPTPYDAVVLGSAIYIGRWRKGATSFLKANQEALAERKVWLFSSGPTGEGDPVEMIDGKKVPDALQPTVDQIQPQDVTVFHGVLDPDTLSFIERWVVKRIGASFGDFRDWDAITSWAGAIADALTEEK